MKKYSITLLFIFVFVDFVQAQSDDKFYFPTKEWDPIAEDIKYEEVSLQTDTVTLNGIFLKPESEPKGTVLFFHGSGGNVSRYLFMTKPLVDKGYKVFMIDFRGYGKSTGKPTHLNIAADGQFVFDYLLSREDVADEKLILFGASIGTQVATKLARDNPGKVRALILDGPMQSFTSIALYYAPENHHAIIQEHLISPYAAEEDIRYIRDIPVLIVHSKEDKEVPMAGAEVVFENAPLPKEFWVYEGKHLMAMQLDPETYLHKIERLLQN